MWNLLTRRSTLSVAFLLSYGVLCWYALHQEALPATPCVPGARCFHPLVQPGERLALELYLHQATQEEPHNPQWRLVDTCRLTFEIPSSGKLPQSITKDQNCTVILPPESRLRWSPDSPRKGEPLRALFLVRTATNNETDPGPVIAEEAFYLTRIVERTSSFWSTRETGPSRNLLETSSKETGESKDHHTFIPHLKYAKTPVLLRIVAEYRQYGYPPLRNDGLSLSTVPFNRTAYRPQVYVDENSLQHSAQVEMAPPGTEKPPIQLQIQVSALSPVMDVVNRHVTTAIAAAESFLEGSELDELRYFIRDDRLFRFFLTQIISFLHMTLDYMAFRDEVRFYRGRTEFSGVAVSSVATRLVCSIILFLYLLDAGGTSWVVLLGILSSISVEAWKVFKLLGPKLVPRYPFLVVNKIHSPKEVETAQYDRIAVRYLSLLLGPLVVAWSLYALYTYKYTSWYSWLISNLANAVYTFGFITLCPQLYVNFRLKSVAHLPWKVFLYKIFNTFVDDAFAWLIEMPWKHRIMTLQDDVIFLLFLGQAYLYRVDKTRTNEYGYSYEQQAVSSANNTNEPAKTTDTTKNLKID